MNALASKWSLGVSFQLSFNDKPHLQTVHVPSNYWGAALCATHEARSGEAAAFSLTYKFP